MWSGFYFGGDFYLGLFYVFWRGFFAAAVNFMLPSKLWLLPILPNFIEFNFVHFCQTSVMYTELRIWYVYTYE